jgi:hypothetical protein
VRRHRKLFLAYSAIYPVVWAITRLDGLNPWASGYMLIASYRRGDTAAERPPRASAPRGGVAAR